MEVSLFHPSPASLSFIIPLSLFLLALHFLGFAEVWDYDLEWDRLPDLSQGYTRIAAIVPSHRSHCLGIDEWICICLAPELNFSLSLSRFASSSLSPSVFSRRSSMRVPRIILPPRIWMPKRRRLYLLSAGCTETSASVEAMR